MADSKRTWVAGREVKRSMAGHKEPWYAEGLAFTCTQCGNCCTGEPGYVWVTPEEMQGIADLLGLPFDDFTRQFVRQVDEHYSLVEYPSGECVFWDASQGCTVYPARPVQCRTWPFWPPHLENRRSWQKVERFCPGSGQGRMYSVEEIETQARQAAEALHLRTR